MAMLVHQRVWVPFCSISGRELSSTRTEHLDRFIEPTGDPFLPIRGPPCLFRSHSSMAVSEVNSRILAFDWIDCSHIPLSRQTFGEFLNDGGHHRAPQCWLNHVESLIWSVLGFKVCFFPTSKAFRREFDHHLTGSRHLQASSLPIGNDTMWWLHTGPTTFFAG